MCYKQNIQDLNKLIDNLRTSVPCDRECVFDKSISIKDHIRAFPLTELDCVMGLTKKFVG